MCFILFTYKLILAKIHSERQEYDVGGQLGGNSISPGKKKKWLRLET